jgi:phosphatidate cytidylyltransferase
MLRTRLITAFIALPIVLAGVFVGGLWFLVGSGIFALVAGWEYSQMMKTGGYHPTAFITLALILALLIDAHYSLQLLSPIITITLLFSLVWQLFRRNSTTPTADWALTLAGGLYIGWGLAHLVALRQLADGLPWVCLTLAATWLSDTFAYLVGRAVGRHKLWPRHSPGKTWEGFIGGIGGGLFGAALIVPFASTLTWSAALIIGAIIPIAGLFGDLAISMMKRQVGVKDSSNLFPGHGGFLDRIDSLLFVSVVVYYYVSWMR